MTYRFIFFIENKKLCCSEAVEVLGKEIGNLKLPDFAQKLRRGQREIGKKRMQKCRVFYKAASNFEFFSEDLSIEQMYASIKVVNPFLQTR